MLFRKSLTILAILLVSATAAADELWPLPPGAVARVGSTRLRHGDDLTNLAYSTDGKSLVSVDDCGRVCIWDTSSGELKRRLRIDSGFIFDRKSIWLNPSGKILSVGGFSGFRCFDISTGAKLFSTELNELRIAFVTESRDGKIAALVMHHGGIRLIDIESGRAWDLRKSRKPTEVTWNCAAFSGEHDRLFVYDEKAPAITVFDTATSTVERTIKAPDGKPMAITASPDGRTLAAIVMREKDSRSMYTIEIMDLLLADKWRRLFTASVEPQLFFSPDSSRLIFVAEGNLYVFDSQSVKKIRELPFESVAVALSPDGKTIALASNSGEIELIDVATGALRLTKGSPSGRIHDLQFHNHDRQLLVAADSTQVWDWKSGHEAMQLPPFGTLSPDHSMRAIRIGGALVLQETSSRKITHFIWTNETNDWEPVFSGDGRIVFSVSNRIQAWDVSTGKRKYAFAANPAEQQLNPVSAGEIAGIIRDYSLNTKTKHECKVQLYFWNSDTGKPLIFPEIPIPESARHMSLSSDGMKAAIELCEDQHFAMLVDRVISREEFTSQILVWDILNGRNLRAISEDWVRAGSLRISPDGRSIVVASSVYEFSDRIGGSLNYDKTKYEVRIWETATGQVRRIFSGHHSEIDTLAYSSDGRYLASASVDAPIFIWDVYGLLPSEKKIAEAEADRLWDYLGYDSSRSFEAVRALISQPQQALVLLQKQLVPAEKTNPAKISQWIAELSAASFRDREQAIAKLSAIGECIEKQLKEALSASHSLEQQRRLQSLIDRLTQPASSVMQKSRALEVLEHIGNKEARALLAELAKGDPEARLTREARESLKRTEKK